AGSQAAAEARCARTGVRPASLVGVPRKCCRGQRSRAKPRALIYKPQRSSTPAVPRSSEPADELAAASDLPDEGNIKDRRPPGTHSFIRKCIAALHVPRVWVTLVSPAITSGGAIVGFSSRARSHGVLDLILRSRVPERAPVDQAAASGARG